MVKRIRTICDSKGLSIFKLEQAAGLSNGSVNKWDKNAPSIDKVLRVCAVLEVPLSAVVDDPYAQATADYSYEERCLISAWRKATDKERATICVMLEDYGMRLEQDASEKLSG